MKITSLASGSSGNAYVINGQLLLEAGLSPNKLKKKLWKNNLTLGQIDACFISHNHKDHSRAASFLADSGIDIVIPISEDGEENNIRADRLYPINGGKTIKVNNYFVKAVDMSHGEHACLGYFVLDTDKDERLFYATDSMYIKQNPQNVNYLMIEVNYQQEYLEEAIQEGQMSRANMRRVLKNHMSLENAIKFLNSIELSEVKEIWVLHVSSRNANRIEIKEKIQKETGKPVYLA